MCEKVNCIELETAELFCAEGPEDWTREQVNSGIEKLVQISAGVELVHLKGTAPDWALCMAAEAMSPSVLQLDANDRVGHHTLICTPFPIDAGGSDTGVEMDVHELGGQALISVRCDPSRFDFLRFDDIVAPPVTPGMRVVLCGRMPVPIAVSLALSYSEKADSIWISSGPGGEYDFCVVSHSAAYRPGDRFYRKIQQERTGQYG